MFNWTFVYVFNGKGVKRILETTLNHLGNAERRLENVEACWQSRPHVRLSSLVLPSQQLCPKHPHHGSRLLFLRTVKYLRITVATFSPAPT